MYFLKGFIDFLTILFRRPKFLAMIATLLLTVMTVMTVWSGFDYIYKNRHFIKDL